MSSIAVNPYLTTNPGGLFDVDTNGFSQGFTWDNPSTYMYLEGGIFNPSATVQLIGGLPIVEIVASENGNGRGQTIEIATTNASITGFSTFDRCMGGDAEDCAYRVFYLVDVKRGFFFGRHG